MKRRIFFFVAVLISFGIFYSCSQLGGAGQETVVRLQVSEGQAEEACREVMTSRLGGYDEEQLHFSWHFIPSVFYALQSADSNGIQKEDLDSYAGSSSFLLEIKADKYHDELLKFRMNEVNDYYRRIEYYSFHFHKDVQLVVDGDTFPCRSHHFERTYGVAPTVKISVNFPVPEEKLVNASQVKLELYDRIFGQGIIKQALEPGQIKTIQVTKR